MKSKELKGEGEVKGGVKDEVKSWVKDEIKEEVNKGVKDGIKEEVEISVILPTYNESGNITHLIERIDRALTGRRKEIIVIDDDSPDKTWQIAAGAGHKEKGVRVIRRTENKGLANSLKRGIAESKGKFIVWMDADLSMPPETIPRLLAELENNHIAVASRYAQGGKDLRPRLRLVTSRMINLAANFILNFKVLDYTSGFIAARREVLAQLPLPDSTYGEYCIAFLYRAGRKGYKIKEVPYYFIDRLEGSSKTAGSLTSLLKFGWVYFKRVVSLRLGGE